MDKIIKVQYMYIYKFMYVQNYYLMKFSFWNIHAYETNHPG